jgi:hypothetical protein
MIIDRLDENSWDKDDLGHDPIRNSHATFNTEQNERERTILREKRTFDRGRPNVLESTGVSS